MGAVLLIDNSNSFTKFALSNGQRVGTVRKLATRDLSPEAVKARIRGWRFDAAVVCSVVPVKGDLLQTIFHDLPTVRVGHRSNLGVGIDYPKPETIGADRLANAAAAAALYRPPAVVVDFGTAVSFDIISAKGDYVGGVIAPGLEAMTDYLHQRTALLPKITLLEPPGPIGKSTKHAMLAGAVYGYRGLVRQILVEIRKSLGARKRAAVIATGGYAELIAAGLPEIATVHPTLTLEGLRIIALREFPTLLKS
ncbi:MAG: Type pantothenate kinase [Verrucomicrobiota bacterium]|jgi:type III pantothenate kinase